MWMLRRVALAAALSGCGASTPSVTDAGADAPALDAPTPTDASAPVDASDVPAAQDVVSEAPCDPVAPTRCGLPFPNDYWTAPDPTTPTGLRVRFNDEMLPRATPRWFEDFDGFSPASVLLAHLPGATAAGLASSVMIPRSLDADARTVVLDAETGQRVAHFAEVDVTSRDPMRRALMIRPAVGLTPGRRYVVAIRGVRDASDGVIAPSDAFRALRDDTPSGEVTAAQRTRYRRIFDALTRASINRNDLQLAWDFTVASRQTITRRMVEMRDAALAQVGAQGPSYRIATVQRNPREGVAMWIEGEVTVPLYLTRAEPPASLSLGPDGALRQNGTAGFVFWMLVPTTALTRPAGVSQYAHGLLSSGEDLWRDPASIALANTANVVIVGMDFQGMSEEDTPSITAAISGNDIGRFRDIVDRQHQGMINSLMLMRAALGRMPADPMLQHEGRALIDPARRFYFGGSQGGIFGGTYMALSTDVRRGILAVPGQSYALMLSRSINFASFEAVLRARFPDPLDIPRVVDLVQMLWDRSEPSGYTPYVRENLFPNTPAHEALLLVSIGDRQVPPLSAHLMARTMGGVVNLAPLNREIYGIPAHTGMHTGSAMLEFSFGLEDPVENVPAAGTPDPHSRIGESPAAFVMAREWLETGATQNRCEGPCDPG
jgi:hypothetical protein